MPRRHLLFPSWRSRVRSSGSSPRLYVLAGVGGAVGPCLPPRVPRAGPGAGASAGSAARAAEVPGWLTSDPVSLSDGGQSLAPPAPAVVWPFGWRTPGALGLGVCALPAYPGLPRYGCQGEIRRCETRVRSGCLPFRDPPQGRPPPRSRARGVLRVSLRVRVPVKGCLGGQVPRAGGPGRARRVHVRGASLIHVQLLRLST